MKKYKTQDLEQCLQKHGVRLGRDNVVTWRSDSKDHPQNWNALHKSCTVLIIVWLEFYMTAVSSSGAAAAKAAMSDYKISEELAVFTFITVYLLGQTVGGIFCSPISECFGRRTIYIVASGSFAIFSFIVAAPDHVAGVFVGRFFQGVSAAIPATVAFGNFSDLFDAERRIWVIYAYTLFGMSGLAVGPIYSSYVTMNLGWRWVFHIAAIVSGLSAFACYLIRESNASELLTEKTEKIKMLVGDYSLAPNVDKKQNKHPMHEFFTAHIRRPIMFTFTEPLVVLCAILCGIAFGLIYGLTESLTIVYTTSPFNDTFDDASSSLSFVAILIGFFINVLPRAYDIRVLRQRRSSGKHITPEIKIWSFAIACPILSIGLWIFAWTVPPRVEIVPWPVSMLGLVCIGFAANDFSYVLFGYITDSYGFNAASAVAVLSSARTLAAAVFPLFVKYMYDGLGNNIATTLLAVVATVFCFTPYLFLRYGSTLRARSKWAASGDDVLEDENKHMQQASGAKDTVEPGKEQFKS